MRKVPTPSDFDESFPWYTRGWTLQQRVLSKRALVFTQDTVYCTCSQSRWYEGFSNKTVGTRDPRFDRNFGCNHMSIYQLKHGRPFYRSLEQYVNLVHEYTKRQLTFEHNAHNAFMGIISAMSGSFPDGFLFGVPLFSFDIGLCWTRVSAPIKRRAGFPSWSWLGWSGEVHIPKRAYLLRWNPLDRKALVVEHALLDWYATTTKCSYPISNSYYQFRNFSHQTKPDLPTGWTSVGPVGIQLRVSSWLLVGREDIHNR